MKPKIRLLLEGVHMGRGHDGLAETLKKEAGVKVRDLENGDLVMCLNTRGDKMKVIGGRGLVIGYLKMPNGQRIMKDALQYIPRALGAQGFDYDKACKLAIEERFQRKASAHGPLNARRAEVRAGL